MDKRNAITVEEAQERLRQIKIDVRTEWMKAVDSLGRICAQDVYSIMDQPPFPRLRGQKHGCTGGFQGKSREAECG